mgnify:CR=1 FL=1
MYYVYIEAWCLGYAWKFATGQMHFTNAAESGGFFGAFTGAAGDGMVFAGGMGGVHRGAGETFDVSADLTEMTRSNVALVTAGAKAILDLPRGRVARLRTDPTCHVLPVEEADRIRRGRANCRPRPACSGKC